MANLRYRGTGLQGKELQLVVEAVEDRILGVPGVSASVNSAGASGVSGGFNSPVGSGVITESQCIPLAEAGIRAIILRDIQRVVAQIENRIKISLYPKRKTGLARTPREVYENKPKFSQGQFNSFLTPASRTYPTWDDLTAPQQDLYSNNQALYTDGTLPWDLMQPNQRQTLARELLYVPNKSADEERLDGKQRSYIQLYEKHVIKIHKLALEIQDPNGLGIPYLNRSYSENEYFLYKESGGLVLFPAQAKISATGYNNTLSSYGYGLIVPAIPQILAVDYEYGLQEIPYDLQDAIALLTAVRVFESVNIAFTQGLLNFSVQGFSAAFGDGLYVKVMDRYRAMAEDILSQYHQVTMTGW